MSEKCKSICDFILHEIILEITFLSATFIGNVFMKGTAFFSFLSYMHIIFRYLYDK